jgi:pSer/pThr/pTyr-binding forkhead associated (FHA) protein
MLVVVLFGSESMLEGGTVKVDLVRPDTLHTFRLHKFPVIIGRDQEADVHLDDPAAAAYQCMLDRIEDTVVIWDLGTGKGTRVNGVPVTKAALIPGDMLTVGQTDLVVMFAPARDCQLVCPLL